MNYKPLILAAAIAASLGLATAGTAEAHDHGGGRFLIAHNHGGWGGHHWHDRGWGGGGFGIAPLYGFYGPDYYGYYDGPYYAPYAYWRFARHHHDHWRFHRTYY